MLGYHLGWTKDETQATAGKGVRPRLVFLVCRAEGADWRAALPTAAAVELLHSFSLVHDDVEDESDSRWGRPTLWKRWGRALAINAGDALFVLAHRAMLETGSLEAMARFVEAALGLCQGQHLDLTQARQPGLGLATYHELVGGKTAALLGLSCELGALAAGAGPQRREAYGRFGRELGLAYQIGDDLLGTWGEPEVTGKPVGDDLRQRKLTYPVAHAWEALQGARRGQLETLWRREAWSEEDVRAALALLEACGARAAARERARAHIEAAGRALPPGAGDRQARSALEALAGLVAERRT